MKKSIGSGRGSVYNILLKALQSGDKYGYEICKEVEEKTNGDYILKQASLYSGLKRLEAQNLITSYWKDSALGGRRHYYSITDAGKSKIEVSNFSWEDSRDGIVDSLFEKSAIDKEIDNVSNDINSLKKVALNSQEENDKIDEILEKTNTLVNQNEENKEKNNDESSQTQPNMINTTSDLFSMFNTISPSENDNNKSSKEIFVKSFESDDNEKENLQKSFDGDEKNDENIDKNDDKKASLKNQNDEIKNEDNLKKITDNGVKESSQLDLFSFANESNKTNESVQEKPICSENFSKDETTLNMPLFKENFDYKCSNTNNSNNVVANDKSDLETSNAKIEKKFDNQILPISQTSENLSSVQKGLNKVLQKNNYNAVDDYKKQHIFATSFAESQTLVTPQKTNFSDFSLFENEMKLNENETNSENLDNGKNDLFTNNVKDIETKQTNVIDTTTSFDSVLDSSKNVDCPVTKPNENVELTPNQNTLNIKNIFGDLVSSQNSFAQEQTNDTFSNNDNFGETNTIPKQNIVSFVDELPRIENKNDINRTLNFQKTSTSIDYPSENPFEKYDKIHSSSFSDNESYVDNNGGNLHQQVPVVNQNIPFDKKYVSQSDSENFEIPDYQIRYYKKNQPSTSKFISINKLNLVNSFVLCLFLYICTSVCLIFVGTPTNLSKFQIFLFFASYIIPTLILVVNFFKYALNKQKKIATLNHSETMISVFCSILLLFLSIAVNLFMGFNFSNITKYIGSFALPICYSFALLISPLIKKILCKFKNFYV